MAEVARSIDDFLKDSRIKYKRDPADEVRRKVEMPKDFLGFFKALVSFISQYNEAFKEENFNRMSQMIVAANDSVLKYVSTNNNEVKSVFEKISKEASEKVLDYAAKKKSGYLSAEEASEQINGVLSDLKDELFAKIKEIVFGNRSSNSPAEAKSSMSSFSPQEVQTLDVVNSHLLRENAACDVAVQKFSVNLGKLITSEFVNAIKTINADNLKSFQRGIDKMNVAYSSQFYGIVSETNAAMGRAESRNKTLFQKLSLGLARSAIVAANTITAAVSSIAVAYFSARFATKRLLKWVGGAVSAVYGVLRFGFRLAGKIISAAFKTAKFLVLSLWKIASFAVRMVSRALFGAFSLANKLFKAVSGFSVLSVLKGALKAFILSYPGAYFLGYVCGRLWGSVLKLLGADNQGLSDGKFSFIHDGVYPALAKAKNKIKSLFGEKAESFNGWWDSKLAEIQSSKTYKDLVEFGGELKLFLSDVAKSLSQTYRKLHGFMNSYVYPALNWVYEAMGIFLGEAFSKPRTFIKTYGALNAGLHTISILAKHVKLRGGLAAMLAGGVLAGASIALGTGVGSTSSNGEDEDAPIKLPISKRYAWLYGYGAGPSEGEAAESRFRPQIEIDWEFLHSLRERWLRERDPEKKRALGEQYAEIERNYRTLISRRDKLWSYDSIIDELVEAYDEDRRNGKSSNNDFWKVSNMKIVYEMLSDDNGRLILDPKAIDSDEGMSTLDKLSFLKAFIAERLVGVNGQLAAFKELSTSSMLGQYDLSSGRFGEESAAVFSDILDRFRSSRQTDVSFSSARGFRDSSSPIAKWEVRFNTHAPSENFDLAASVGAFPTIRAPEAVVQAPANPNTGSKFGTIMGLPIYDQQIADNSDWAVWLERHAAALAHGAGLTETAADLDEHVAFRSAMDSYLGAGGSQASSAVTEAAYGLDAFSSVNIRTDWLTKIIQLVKPIVAEFRDFFTARAIGAMNGADPGSFFDRIAGRIDPYVEAEYEKIKPDTIGEYSASGSRLSIFDIAFNVFSKAMSHLAEAIRSEEGSAQAYERFVLDTIEELELNGDGEKFKRCYDNYVEREAENREAISTADRFLKDLGEKL